MTPETIAALMQRAYLHQQPWSAGDVTGILNRPTTRIFERDHGILIAQQVADEAEILALATDPAMQRRGIARALLGAFHAKSAAEGVTRAVLDVAEDNAPARALYQGAGYIETARRADYYRRADGSRSDALLMSRALP